MYPVLLSMHSVHHSQSDLETSIREDHIPAWSLPSRSSRLTQAKLHLFRSPQISACPGYRPGSPSASYFIICLTLSSVIRLPLSNPSLLNNPPLTTGQTFFLQAPRLWRAASTLFVIPAPFPLSRSREGIHVACPSMYSFDFSGLCALALFCSLCFSFLILFMFAVLGMEARPCLC